jgi:16S rRNA (guanine527-N7)-methyltransferase
VSDIEQSLVLLEEGMEKLGLSMEPEQRRRFSTYLKEIELFNSTYRLVGAQGRDLVVKHLLDSLAALPLIRELLEIRGPDARLCDVGSGAGLPGIPLAIMLLDHRVTLVERSGRRSGFLRNVVALCNLDDRVDVIQSDLSEVIDTFEVVTFRAFHPLEDIIRPVGNILSDRGFVCAYNLVKRGKGGSVSGWSHRIIPLSVPFLDDPRAMCVLQKAEAGEEVERYGN